MASPNTQHSIYSTVAQLAAEVMSGDFILLLISAILIAGALVVVRYCLTWKKMRADASHLDISLD